MTATWRLRKDINVVLVHKINWRNVWKCIIFSPLEFDIGRHFCAFGKNLKCAIFLISRYTEYEEELTVSGFDIRNVARIIVDFADVKVVMILLVIGSVSFLWRFSCTSVGWSVGLLIRFQIFISLWSSLTLRQNPYTVNRISGGWINFLTITQWWCFVIELDDASIITWNFILWICIRKMAILLFVLKNVK